MCITPWCASHRGVNNLPSVCFDSMFYKCYFSVMPRDINIKIILYVTNCLGSLFYFLSFSKERSQRVLQIQNTKNGDIPNSMTPRCASHRGVELCDVHPTTKSSYKVCIPPRSQAPWCASYPSQAAHSGVKIEIIMSLWLLLKGQSREILYG